MLKRICTFLNPVVLVELPNGITAWTQGQNLALKLEDIPGYVATIEAENGKAAEEEMTKNFEDVLGKVYYFDDEDVGSITNRPSGLLYFIQEN